MKEICRFVVVGLFVAVVFQVAPVAAQSPVMDGYLRDPVTGVAESPYVLSGISYTQDQVTGQFSGYLYSAQDDQNLYFGFEQSVFINDNTYGANSIGWPVKEHRLRDLTNSEHAKIEMFDCNNNLALSFYLDYVTFDKSGNMASLGVTGGDGAMLVGSASSVTGAGASLAWNFNQAAPTWPSKLTLSPARVPTNTYDPGTAVDPNFPWIFELTYEWSVARSAFPGGCFGGLKITEVHNSPYKTGFNPVPVPVLTVSKEADPPSGSTVLSGNTILYTVKYSNPGPLVLNDVLITDVVDTNLSDVVPLDGGSYDPATRTITWPVIAAIGAGESGNVRFTAVVSPVSAQSNAIYNTATFTTPNLPTPAKTNTTVHYIQHSPDLALTKECPPELTLGAQATYTMTVTNLGFGTAPDVLLLDTLPPQTAFVSASPAPVSVNGQEVTFDLGELAYGQTASVALTVAVISGDGIPVNTAVVSTTTPEGGEQAANDTASCASTMTGADVYAAKTCPPQLVAGAQAVFEIEAGNAGTAAANEVVVVDTLPQGLTFVSATPAPAFVDGSTLVFQLGTLGVGEIVTISVLTEVTATAGVATNQVAVSMGGMEGGEGTSNNNDQCSSPFVAPDIAVDKTCPIDMVAGKAASYSLVVSNQGTAPAYDVSLVDTLPTGVTFVSATPAPQSIDGGTLTFSLGEIGVGQAITVTIGVAAEATSGTATNVAAAFTGSIEGGLFSANNSDSCTSTFKAPDLSLDLACPIDMVAGETAQYVISVANAGNATADNVVVTDLLPAGVSFVSATPAPLSVVGQTITFALGDLPAGASASLTVRFVADSTAGTALNTASVTSSSIEGGQAGANNSDSCTSSFLAPDIAVDKTCPIDVIAGQGASYLLLVSNSGNTTAKGVVVTDDLPAGVTFVSAIPAPLSVAGQTVTFDLGDMAAGISTTIILEVYVSATAGQATNVASASTTSIEGGLAQTNNSDSCASNFLSPDLAVDLTCPVDMVAGTNASYSIMVSNLGTTSAGGVTVTDVLPAGVTFVSASPAPAFVDGQTLTFQLGELAAGASAVIVLDVSVQATAGTAVNGVSVSSSSLEGGEGFANNDASCSSSFLAPDLELFKGCPVDMVAGEPSSYTLTVTNLGTSTANDVVVTDTLPEGVVFLSAVPEATLAEGNALTFSLGDLAAGATIVIVVEVGADAVEGIAVNTATVSTTSIEGGEGLANNSDSCTTGFLAPDVELTKTCPMDMVAGEGAAYTLAVTNAGSTAALSVVIIDTLPEGVSFLSATPAPSMVDGQTLFFSLGDMDPGLATTITIQVLATSVSGSATNTAAASTTSVEGGLVGANNSDSCTSNFLSPDVVVSVDCPIDMVAGEQAAYTITVSNAGSTTAKAVTVTDVLPDGVSFVSAVPAPVSVNGQSILFALGDLAAGASSTITIAVMANATAGSALNAVSATSSSIEGGGGIANNSAACTSSYLSPDVALVLDCPIDMVAGEQAAYTLTVTNSGSTTANAVVVTDTLPAGVTFVSATPAPASINGQVVTFLLGDLPAGASTTIIIRINADATAGNAASIATVATGSIEGGQGSANNSAACSSNFLSPDLVVDLTCPVDMVAGTGASYSILVTNIGTTSANGVTVTDVLPAGVTFVSATPAPISVSGQVVTFQLGVLAAGDSAAVSINLHVDATAGQASNTVSVASDSIEGGQGSANNSDACSSNFLSPDISLDLGCPIDMIAGQGASYTVTVTNSGNTTATAVTVTDTLPEGVTYVSATPAPVSINGQTLVFNLGDLPAGGSSSITIEVAVSATAGSALNVASVSTDSVEGGQGSANNSDSCSSNYLSPEITLDLGCPIDMIAGQAASYTVTVTNSGNTTATAVTVTDTLPEGVTFVSATPAPVSINGQTLVFNLGDLPAGGSYSITIEVAVSATAGSALHVAFVSTTSVEGGLGAANNSDSCSSNFLSPDISVNAACPIDMIAGEQAAYTVTISNTGNAAADSVEVTDVLPAGVSFVSATPAPASINGQTLVFNLGDLPAGASTIITIEVMANATAGSAVNSVSATTPSTEGAFGTANNNDSCSSSYLSPDVALVLDCPIDMVAGEQAAYTLTVTNSGSTTANAVVVTDTLPAGVTFVSATPTPASISGQVVTFLLGDFPAGASTTIIINVNVDATAGNAANTATVTTDSIEGGQGSANNNPACSSTLLSADVTVSTQCAPAAATTNSPYSFVTNFANIGSAAAMQTLVIQQIPAGFFGGNQFLVSSTLGAATVNGLQVTVDLGTLPAGASGVLTITGTVAASSTAQGTYSTQVAVSTVSVQASSSNDTGDCSVQVAAPALSVTKESAVTTVPVTIENSVTVGAAEIVEVASAVRTDTVVLASVITYTITVTNSGTAAATDIAVLDTLPAGVTIVSNPDAGIVLGNTVSWNIPTLAAGAATSLTLAVQTQNP